MAKNEKLVAQIRSGLERKTTKELLGIWTENNRTIWTSEAFIAIQDILLSRGVNVPDQKQIQEPLRGVQSWTSDAMKRELRIWGILFLAGGITNILSGEYVWGLMLLILGILNLFVIHQGVYLADGLLLLASGVYFFFFGNWLGRFGGGVQVIIAMVLVAKFVWHGLTDEKKAWVLSRIGKSAKENIARESPEQ